MNLRIALSVTLLIALAVFTAFTRKVTARKSEERIIQSDGGADVDVHLLYS
jgi:hypothetical protein